MSEARPRKLLSVITPVFNEEDTVRRCHAEVRRVCESLSQRYDWEHVFANNCSSDRTLDVLRELAASDPHVRVLSYSRNFGAEKSAFTALRHTRGDVVVGFSADLQEPPDLLPHMIEQYEQGFKVVYGVYENPNEAFTMRQLRRLYYWLADKLSPDPLPHGFTGFALMDRRVVDEVVAVDDYAPYIRGLIATVGFKQIAIPYERHARKAGRSKHGLAFLFDFGLNGIVSHSFVPIRLATIVGALLSFTALALAGGYAILKLLHWDVQAPGATTVIVLVLFFFGVQFLFFGILGEYIGAIHAQVRRKPFVIIEEKINFDEPLSREGADHAHEGG
jgi:glycosyltransferase involved in cell wall biosynthesis